MMKSFKIKELVVGQMFFFCDPDLAGGINRLTCYRRTRTGVTNLVTHKRSTFSSNTGLEDRLVVKWEDATGGVM